MTDGKQIHTAEGQDPSLMPLVQSLMDMLPDDASKALTATMYLLAFVLRGTEIVYDDDLITAQKALNEQVDRLVAEGIVEQGPRKASEYN